MMESAGIVVRTGRNGAGAGVRAARRRKSALSRKLFCMPTDLLGRLIRITVTAPIPAVGMASVLS